MAKIHQTDCQVCHTPLVIERLRTGRGGVKWRATCPAPRENGCPLAQVALNLDQLPLPAQAVERYRNAKAYQGGDS